MSLQVPRADVGDLSDDISARHRVQETEVALAGRVWDIRRDTVDLGAQGTVVREYLDHPGSVAVVALRHDRGTDELLMLHQYRHPVGAQLWELPAGLLDVAGEDAVVAAARELEEEADLRAERWHLLAEYLASPGGTNEALRIYLARDLSDVPAAERHVREHEEAAMTLRWVDLDDAAAAVTDGRIQNAAAVVGVLAAIVARQSGWATVRDAGEPWPAHPRSVTPQ